ncbi:hypothetical protein LCGC14_3079140 [marine sediment metagenome]|uniref:Uncharacterized protein n=1 Tax=marine sediment metagenome TaxID=412755 RepID=A0A0F8WDT2_9ZZZZ
MEVDMNRIDQLDMTVTRVAVGKGMELALGYTSDGKWLIAAKTDEGAGHTPFATSLEAQDLFNAIIRDGCLKEVPQQ